MAALVFGGPLPPFMRPPVADSDFSPPRIEIEALSFSDLEGWRRDDQAQAIPVFLRSCARLETLADDAPVNPKEALGREFEGLSLGGRAGDWREACADARAYQSKRYADATAAAAAARALFEYHFRPLKIVKRRVPLPDGSAKTLPDRIEETALVTAYYEPVFEASTFRTRQRSAPVLARPADLVTVDLGRFREEFAGERIAGFVRDGSLAPYPDHRAINDGALGEAAAPIAWLDPNDLFFLQIQGSGRLKFPNGREIRVGFDGHNGRPYTAIGRILIERGVLSREKVSMQTIRDWLQTASPAEARALREANESYVFFRVLDDLPDPERGPLGAGGVQLTAGRSLAIDRRYYPLGAPVWLSTPAAPGRAPEIFRLFVAQDAGGAIKGPLRADIFLGSGPRAGRAAGRLRAEGALIALVPRGVAQRLAAARAISSAREG